MNRRKVTFKENKTKESRWQQLRHIWITKWNIICVKVVAIISFTCIIATVLILCTDNVDDNIEDDETKTEYFVYSTPYLRNVKSLQSNSCTYTKCSYWGDNFCCFHCYKVDERIATHMINTSYYKNNCFNSIFLILQEVIFKNKIMSKDWWYLNINVSHIIFKKCYLFDIEDGAFSSKYFRYTKTITFSQSHIPYYRKNMFIGMTSIADFQIQDTNQAMTIVPDGVKFEFGVLEYFQNCITTLQIQRTLQDADTIRNLTSIPLNALQIIDFRYNDKLRYIPDNAFNTFNLKQLFLSDCALEYININAFQKSLNLAEIYLDNNQLETINEKTFSMFYVHNIITISRNNWDCNCDLMFITIYERINDFDETICKNGSFLSQIFKNCREDYSTITSLTTISSTARESTPPSLATTVSEKITTTVESTTFFTESTSKKETTISDPADLTKIPQTSSIPTTISTKNPFTSTPTEPKITCQPVSKRFYVQETTEHEILVIYTSNLKNDEELMIFSPEETYCIVKDNIGHIKKANTPYIACYRNSNKLECISGRSPASYEQQTWLKNSEKIPVVAISIFVALLAIVSSIIATYFCIRNRPKLSYVKNPAPEVKVIPRLDNQTYRISPEPSYLPVQESVYLTPVSQRYMQMKEKYDRPNLQRSLSDLSMKTVASYVTENQIMSMRSHCRPDRMCVHRVFEEPPPLPPPLPPPRNRYEEIMNERDIRARNMQQW